MDIDDVYIRTGEFGKFQKRAFLAMCLGTMFAGTQMVQNIFAGAIPVQKNCSVASIDPCDETCPSVLYPEDGFESFATQWKMTCGSGIAAVQSTQSILMAGVMLGSFVLGGFGDRYGRFPALLICQLGCSFFAFVSSFATSWIAYCVLRFLTGFFLSGIIAVGFVLMSELVGPSKRGIVGTIPALTFAIGIGLLSLTAYKTQNWRTMSTVLGILGFLITPLVYFLFEESPRWHLGKGNTEKCQQILNKIAHLNGHNLGDFNLKVASTDGSGKADISMLSLFRHPILRKITLIQLFTWFVCSAVYYGLTIASGDMGGNRYISVILSAVVEIPSNLAVLYIMDLPKCGRVKTFFVSIVAGALFCGSIWFVADEHKSVIMVLACSGKFFSVMAFALIFVQGAELYPTPVRNVGLGLTSVLSRVGGILAPQIVSLHHIYHNSHFVVFGCLGVIAGLLGLMLPETLGRPLPNTPEEIYRQVKKADSDVVKMSVGSSDRRSLINNMDEENIDM